MAHDSSEHLQYDSRLANRKDWTSRKDLDKNLASLPDLTDKSELLDDSSEEESVEENAEEAAASFEGSETVETVASTEASATAETVGSTETVEPATESPVPPLGEPTHEV